MRKQCMAMQIDKCEMAYRCKDGTEEGIIMEFEKMRAYGLLEEVKKDALRKVDGMKPDRLVYALIQKLISLQRMVFKEGLLALEEAVHELPPEFANLPYMTRGIAEYVITGIDPDLVVEMLETEYWAKNPQGMEALIFYICIRGIMEIQSGQNSPYVLELLLKSVLTEEGRAEYERYKEEEGLAIKPKTPREELEEIDLQFCTKGKILRKTLEEMLAHVSDGILKKAVCKMKNEHESDLELTVKGLSSDYRKRLFSCMSEAWQDQICEDLTCIGPVRAVDIEDAFVCLIDCIEGISGESRE